jgi:hypothetical protein
MGKHDEILEALRDHAKKVGPQATMLAKVKSVDAAKFTCVLDDDGLEYLDVRLRPVLDGKQAITAFPKVSTWALAVRIEDGEDWMVVAFGEVDKVRMVQGSLVFEMEDYFLLKKGNETLKKIMGDLLDAIGQITVPTNVGPSGMPLNAAEFTAIKTRINNFLK